MKYAARTDKGKFREKNEDGYLANGKIFAVADGLGGHFAGEVASSIALHVLDKNFKEAGFHENVKSAIKKAFEDANKGIHNKARAKIDYSGMGTTLSVAVPSGGEVYIGHLGDSRIYLLEKGQMKQVTKDHSLVAEMVKQGKLTPEETRHHPLRSVITRALGIDLEVEYDIFSIPISEGSRLLLCTDGLNAMVVDDEIAKILSKKIDLEKVCQQLIDKANEYGGEDNITVVLVEF